MLKLKYIFRILVSLVTNPSETWSYLSTADSAETKTEYMFRNFYYPLLGIMSVIVLISNGFTMSLEDESFSLQQGMTQMVPVLVAYFVGPYLSQSALKFILRFGFHLPDPDKTRLTLFIFYCTGFLMAVESIIAIFPGIQFLMFFRLYVVYLTWSASSNYIAVSETRRWMFGFTSALVLASVPFLIKGFLQMVQG